MISDLAFIRYTLIDLVASSTIVRKNLKPSWVQIDYGPQTSTWIKANGSVHILLFEGNSNLFCLAKGQIVQMSLHLVENIGNTSCKDENLLKEGCPNLKFHKMDMSLFERTAKKSWLEVLVGGDVIWQRRWSPRSRVL